jgi:IS4 transposase
MAELNVDKLQADFRAFLPPDWMSEVARQVGAVVRERKVKISALVWTLVVGFANGSGPRTITALRRSFEQATGETIVASAFYTRFTGQFVRLIRECLNRLLSEASEPERKLHGILSKFKDLVMTDSTVVRLCTLLKARYAGARTNHSPAAAKLHVVMSATGCGPRTVKLTSGSAADGPRFSVGTWVADRLLTFDLGYFNYHLFVRIAELGGFFVSRMKVNANPVIVAENLAHGLGNIALEGRRLLDVLHLFDTEVIDLRVRVNFKRRVYRGRISADFREFRLVGIFNHDTNEYHLYLTNIDAADLTASEVAKAYSFRWEIETFFREVKGCYQLEDVGSANPFVVEALLYSTMITAILAGRLRAAILRSLHGMRSGKGTRIPRRRFAIVFSTVANRLLHLIITGIFGEPNEHASLIQYLEHECKDPNVSRRLLLTGIGA